MQRPTIGNNQHENQNIQGHFAAKPLVSPIVHRSQYSYAQTFIEPKQRLLTCLGVPDALAR
jgi:hypothetical protein